jgi:hypothetical protein
MKIGDLAFGQGHDADTGKAEALVERGHVLLVAREAIQRFGHDHVEGAGARILQQLLVARPQPVGAARGTVRVGGHELPALPAYPLATEPNLILDRRGTLQVGRVASVDGRAHVVLCC